MSGVGKRYVYELAEKLFGDRAQEWLDTPRTGLGDTPSVPVTARSVLESGCPSCVDSVVRAVEAAVPAYIEGEA